MHIVITAHLTEDEARALAQFFKRAQPEDFTLRSANDAESNLMQSGALALREQGITPRIGEKPTGTTVKKFDLL